MAAGSFGASSFDLDAMAARGDPIDRIRTYFGE
jgi:hypothetical protein